MTLLILPIMMLSSAVPDLAAGMACLGRIQDFLVKEKRHDYRTLFKPPSPGSGSEHTDPPSGSDENEKTPWIRIRRGSFSWAKDASPVVKDIDLDIRPGELTLIVGPVASGKSTLLKAILGEAYLVSGSVEFTVPEALAYCDQDAWLLNQTIRNNILAFGEYDEAFYNKVVQACQLLPDLEQLPSGDRTMIGSKGISLSGGQKQRVVRSNPYFAACLVKLTATRHWPGRCTTASPSSSSMTSSRVSTPTPTQNVSPPLWDQKGCSESAEPPSSWRHTTVGSHRLL